METPADNGANASQNTSVPTAVSAETTPASVVTTSNANGRLGASSGLLEQLNVVVCHA